jgi:hypothetical protein
MNLKKNENSSKIKDLLVEEEPVSKTPQPRVKHTN